MVSARQLFALVVTTALGACRDVPTAPPEPVPAEPAYVTVVLDTQFNADYGRAIRYPALVLTGATTLNLVYGKFETGELRYAGCPVSCDNQTYWSIGTPDPGVGQYAEGDYVSAAAADARLLVAYQAWRPSGFPAFLKYGTCPGLCNRPSSWLMTEVDTVGNTGWSVSLAAEPGSAHLAYLRYANPVQLRYATCAVACTTPGAWITATVDTGPLFGETQIVRAAAGTVHIVYEVLDPNGRAPRDLKYATCSAACELPASWQTGTIGAGHLPSLTLAGDGRLHLAYVTGAADVRIASCASGCTAPGAWQGATVVTSPGQVTDVALVIASNGRHHLAYAGWPNLADEGVVRYDVCDSACTGPSGWRSLTVDSTRYRIPDFVSLVLDSNGRVSVAHASSGDIRLTQVK